MSILRIVARLCLAFIFIVGGYSTLTQPGYRVKALSNLGLPQFQLLVRATGLMMVLGGILLVSGIAPVLASGILVLTLIPTTLAGHAFWKETDPEIRTQQITHFTKNLGLIGGLLLEMELGLEQC